MEKFGSYKTQLQFIGKHLQLDGSLLWPKPIAQAIALDRYSSHQSICKTHKASTSNDLQYSYSINFYFTQLHCLYSNYSLRVAESDIICP